MPIKLCQNCGLKVFVEEGQPIPVPFLCARCQAAMRAAQHQHERAPTLTMSNRPRPISVNVPAPAVATAPAPPAAPGEPGKSQLKCPGCSATFSVRLPDQPARGKCPKCFQSLLVYPDGTVVISKSSASGIQPAVGGSLSASRVGQPAVGGGSPSASRVGQPAVGGGSPSASRVGQPAVAAVPADDSDGQAASPSTSRIGRPTGSRPAAPAPEAAPVSPETSPEAAASEPVSMEGPQDSQDVASGSGEAVSDADSTRSGRHAVAASAAGSSASTTSGAAVKLKAGRDAKGLRKIGSQRRSEAALLVGDSTGKLYATVVAVALPVLLGFVLYLLRETPSVAGLLKQVGAPYKEGLSFVGKTTMQAPGAGEKEPASDKGPRAGETKDPGTDKEAGAKPEAAPETPKTDVPAEPKADAPQPDPPKADGPAVPAEPKADATQPDPPEAGDSSSPAPADPK